jgi:AcrR family transcriptional regulator
MKTRDKILLTSLLLFNEEGEPNVTTVDIANEMDISPGNLYYHFKGKGAIIESLYDTFEHELIEILKAPIDNSLNVEDSWFYLYVVFEEIYNFRFFYQNLSTLLQHSPPLAKRFKALLKHKCAATDTVLQALIDNQIIVIDELQAIEISQNINLILTYWLNYAALQDWADNQAIIIHQGVFQVMSLIAPHLSENYQHIYLQQRVLYQQLLEQNR